MYNYGSYISKEFIQDYLSAFLNSVRGDRTKVEYVGYIRLLCEKLGKDFLDITDDDAFKIFHSWKEDCRRGDLSRKTICVRLACYNSLARFITNFDSELEYENPFAGITRPEVTDSISALHVPSLEELDAIMSAASSDPMCYLVLALVSRCGLSATKITQITMNSIVRDESKVGIILKEKTSSKEDNVIVLPDDVATLFINYVEGLPDSMLDYEGHVFYNSRGRALTIKNLDTYISKYVSMANLERVYTLKDIRSRAVLEMIHAGASETEVMKYVNIGPMRTRQFYEAKGLLSDCPANLVNYRLCV